MDSSEDSENEVVNLSLMAKNYESDEEVSLKKSWYIDSGWSKHMMGDASKFNHISPKKSGHVTYGDNNKGRILKIGKIGVIMEENLCRNLPFGGRATRDSRVCVPRKEYGRSRHQRLFEENVEKTGKDVIYEF